MDNIIIIRTPDPDGRIFQSIKKTLESNFVDVIYPKTRRKIELSFPGLTIKPDEGIVLRDNLQVQLNHSEFSTLCCLASHPGLTFFT